MAPPYILGISGSFNSRSVSHLALQTTLEDAAAMGAETEIIRLSDKTLPHFDPHDESADANYDLYKEKILRADALLLATPDYHGGPSGVLKNFLDYFWKEFAGRLTGYICASHEKGLLPMEQLRTHIRQCYGWSLPYGVGISDADCTADRSSVSSANIRGRLKTLAYDLVRYGPPLKKLFDEDRKVADHGFASRYKD